MILKDTLKSIISDQRRELLSFNPGVTRQLKVEIDANASFAIILAGIRRCGKSTLLKQIVKKLENFYYFNFEDPRALGFESSDFQRLEEALSEEYGKCDFYFFDEIQNVDGWENFVRTKQDIGKHFVITGSNASLLSRELGTKLTGRHMDYELFPFSYIEFLKFRSKKPSAESFAEYLKDGGFPGYLEYHKKEALQELLSDIIARDIIVRYGIRSSKTIKELALYLISNSGKEFSYRSLKKIFDLGSVNTAVTFVSHLEDSYLIFSISKFDYSIKKRLINPKKVYSIDNGLANANSISFSDDLGRALENNVFLELRRHSSDIYYFRDKGECDFVIKEKGAIKEVYQVCYQLTEENKAREINGLVEALDTFRLESGLILTYDQEDTIKQGSKRIIIIPVWKWASERRTQMGLN